MKKLVILGYGYLGEAIDAYFTKQNWEVIKVGRTATKDAEQADISSLESLQQLRERIGEVSHVVHCASSGRGGVDAYQDVFERGAINIVKAFPDAHFMFTSSSSVYPQVNGEVVDEASKAEPDRETGKILRRAEEVVLAAGGTVMRLSGIYGDKRSVILKKWLKGESKVEEDGRRMLNQIHRADAAKAYFVVASKDLKGEIFNVSETSPKNQLDTLQWLADHDGKPLPESVPRDLNRKRGWTHKTVSSAKLVSKGWSPQYASFTDAVEDIAGTLELS